MSLALVLAGGGVTGIAWETGVLLGLLDEGVDVVDAADVVIGTSAGSTVGAQVLSGADLGALYARQVAREHAELTPEVDVDALVAIFSELATGEITAAALARVGAMALAAPTVPEARRRQVIEHRLPSHEWGAKPFWVTAVDVATGEFVVFDRHSGVPLVDAVAASCAVPGVWPPVTLHGRRFMDGGTRSTANADLATGYMHVVVLAPLTGPMGAALEREEEALRAEGAEVLVITPDDAAVEAMGVNPLDPAYRPPAAEHGRRQGRAAAGAFAEGGFGARTR